jgi:hypothetical protein
MRAYTEIGKKNSQSLLHQVLVSFKGIIKAKKKSIYLKGGMMEGRGQGFGLFFSSIRLLPPMRIGQVMGSNLHYLKRQSK